LKKKIFLLDYNERRRGRKKREIESKRTEEISTAYSVVVGIENEQYNNNQITPKYNLVVFFLRTSFIRYSI
jgi:hypothetical protein